MCSAGLCLESIYDLPKLWPSHVSWMKRKSAHVNSASCIFFSPAAPSEPTPRPAPALGMYSLFAKFTILCGENRIFHAEWLVGWLVMGVVGVQCNLTTKSGGVWKFWKTKACKDNGEVLKLKKESKLNENAKIIIHGRNVGNPKILNDKRITWLGGEWEQEWNVYYTD